MMAAFRVVVVLIALVIAVPAGADPIVPLKVQGEDFVDPAGKPVKLWGVNLVSFYPEHAKADATAANLAALQINFARPHHNLRRSLDWNPNMVSGSLLSYQDTSRQFEPVALDRFDYMNAALRKQGIYLSFSFNWTRRYRAGDVDILKTDDADREAWMAAMKELNGWHWKKAFDVFKMLPVIDERAALLNEEFARTLLAHVNPYTRIAYGQDPQVLTFEVMNEGSTEYAIICGNRFPEYWDKKLAAKWQAFAKAAGVEGGDLYAPANEQIRDLRANFLRELDEAYFERMKTVLRSGGSQAALTYSNLWRGDNALAMHARTADFIEGHMYGDPLVTRSADDWIAAVGKSAVAGKPFVIGELNQAESAAAIEKQSPVRTMLPLAAAAYGSLHNWSGITWFAWGHGDGMIGEDGWAETEGRKSSIGRMVVDGMQIDHLRTAGLMLRRGMVAPSTRPIIIAVDEPYLAGGYHELMRGKYVPQPGWQNIHAIRKTFGTAAPGQAKAEWMTTRPASPLVSDTGQIVKDIDRQQLTVAAPMAEAFSGPLDGRAPAGLKRLTLEGEGFATVIAVADDGKPLGESQSLVISRTALDANNAETPKLSLTLRLRPPTDQAGWYIKLTRPRDLSSKAEQKLSVTPEGVVQLPSGDWHECELRYRAGR